MRVTNLNPREDIGASAWFVELDGHGVLMDAGIHPKLTGRESLPLFNVIRDRHVDAIAITHCHHDHVGSLPVAIRQFPDAHVMMSELSYFIVERVLHNSVNVMKRQRDEIGITEYPLYNHHELDEIAYLFQGYKYNREIEWASPTKSTVRSMSPTLEFCDAGHALGSSGLMIRGEKETIFYTGDVSFGDQTILKGARFEDIKADVLILETTRGNRDVPAGFSRHDETLRLSAAIEEVMERRGCVLIPTFALGRTQEILALLAIMMREGKLRKQPVYIGGLGRVFTEIYDLEARRAHRNHSNLSLHESLDLIVLDRKQQDAMKLKGGRLFVLTAGMMTEQTPSHELAMRMIKDEKQAIFFVGYADPETPAGRLRAAGHGETFHFSQSAGELTRRCDLQEFDLTAHANRDELLNFVGQVSPHTVILAHGDADSRAWFEVQIKTRHPKINLLQPGPGEAVDI
ncbi:MAG: Ribonuclease [Verrucomicrobia subdivision 3 bacterium]|nr:Ribonuclease [Limisphaerales bacterium]MCS1416332.1 Ribonuclease [Limisphaerales bacterium]